VKELTYGELGIGNEYFYIFLENYSILIKIFRVSTFKCLKEDSKEFVIVEANNYDTGEVDSNAELNIINARAAGFENVDISIAPCVKPSSEYKLCGDAR